MGHSVKSFQCASADASVGEVPDDSHHFSIASGVCLVSAEAEPSHIVAPANHHQDKTSETQEPETSSTECMAHCRLEEHVSEVDDGNFAVAIQEIARANDIQQSSLDNCTDMPSAAELPASQLVQHEVHSAVSALSERGTTEASVDYDNEELMGSTRASCRVNLHPHPHLANPDEVLEQSASASTTELSGEAEWRGELEAAFHEAKLRSSLDAARHWCDQQGVLGIHDILTSFDGLANALELKPLQRKRLLPILCDIEESYPIAPGGALPVGHQCSMQRTVSKTPTTVAAVPAAAPSQPMDLQQLPATRLGEGANGLNDRHQHHRSSGSADLLGDDPGLCQEDFQTKLSSVLQEAELSSHLLPAQHWCAGQGIKGVEGILLSIDAFATILNLKPLQQKRLMRVLSATPIPVLPASSTTIQDAGKPQPRAAGMLLTASSSSGLPKQSSTALAKMSPFSFAPPTAAEAEMPHSLRLLVDGMANAGLHAHASWYGMVIDSIDAVPGQPGLQVGECIIKVGSKSLQELDGPECRAAFMDGLVEGAKLVIETHCETRGKLPACMMASSGDLQGDLKAFAADYEVHFQVSEETETLIMSGPRPALGVARTPAAALLNKWISSRAG